MLRQSIAFVTVVGLSLPAAPARQAGPMQEWPVYAATRAATPLLAARGHQSHERRRSSRSRGSGSRPRTRCRSSARGPGNFQNTPLMIDNVLYLSTPYNRVVALDAETGKRAMGVRSEGVRGRPAAERHRASCIAASPRGATATALRIFMNSRYRLICLDAKTGEPVESFGTNGSSI